MRDFRAVFIEQRAQLAEPFNHFVVALEADLLVKMPESSLFDSNGATRPRAAHIPPRGCYAPLNVTAFATTQHEALRPWIASSIVEKEVFFIPCSCLLRRKYMSSESLKSFGSALTARLWWQEHRHR